MYALVLLGAGVLRKLGVGDTAVVS